MSFLMGGKLFAAGIFGFKFLTFYREQEMCFFGKLFLKGAETQKEKFTSLNLVSINHSEIQTI